MLLKMAAVQVGEESEVLLLKRAFEVRRRIEVEDAWLGGTQNRPLEQRRHKAGGPVVDGVDGVSARVGEDHVGWQVLRF